MADISLKYTKELAKEVASSFSYARLTQEELSAPTTVTDLPWSNPPLVTDLTLNGSPLQKLLDIPMRLTEDALYRFWSGTLDKLYQRQVHTMKLGLFKELSIVSPQATAGHRSFRFSVPCGWPHVGEFAGVEFSIEAAYTAQLSLPVVDLVSDDDNYYVKLPSKRLIGVRDGVPATGSLWDVPVTGMIAEMLRMPRGEVIYDCFFDQIARARSLLHQYKVRFKDPDALDLALQALRKLSFGRNCPQLIAAVQTHPTDMLVLQAREMALRQALEVMVLRGFSDRRKILTLDELLIPLVLSETAFKRKIYDTRKGVPFTVSDSVIARIVQWLRVAYAALPENIKREM